MIAKLLLPLIAVAPAIAQCSTALQAFPADNPDSFANAAVSWDPDGAGPQSALTVVGGSFANIGALATGRVALYDPTTQSWSAIPGAPTNGFVSALATLPNGDLVIGGQFTGAGGFADNIARWDGSNWHAFGTGVNGSVAALHVASDGTLYVGGNFWMAGGVATLAVASWDGSAWQAMPGLSGLPHAPTAVVDLLELPDGGIAAAGGFLCPGGSNLARWDGASWSALAPSSGFALALTLAPNGDLIIARQSFLQRWDGSTSTSFGAMSSPRTLHWLPNGDLLVGGTFTTIAFVPVGHIARWDGSTWSSFGTGFDGYVSDLVGLPQGDVMAVGSFTTADGQPTPFMAQLESTCPATVATYGNGCTGTGGLNELEATTLPWIGSTFRARATGMAPLALVLSVYGFTPLSIPSPSVFPEALPGCSILMTGDILDVMLPNAGIVETAVALPNDPALVAQQFHHYAFSFEVDASLGITAITNTNALTCTVGAF